jgi:hypothetical protein
MKAAVWFITETLTLLATLASLFVFIFLLDTIVN